jgi:hypothetical protein
MRNKCPCKLLIKSGEIFFPVCDEEKIIVRTSCIFFCLLLILKSPAASPGPMLVTSFDYYCFLTVVFFAFWMSRSHRYAPLVLICAANLFFYSRWGLAYLVLIPMASGIDYLLGGAIARCSGKGVRRVLVTTSIFLNLGLIVFCRYGGVPGLVLPLSLSFYAFQALTYTIDIYRGDSKPAPGYLSLCRVGEFFPDDSGRSDYARQFAGFAVAVERRYAHGRRRKPRTVSDRHGSCEEIPGCRLPGQ